jgi:3-isopropylmalate dehydrogenase
MSNAEPTVFKIALLPGDGIGAEVVDGALAILSEIELHLDGVNFEYETFSVGAKEFLATGDPLPAIAFDRLAEFHAILLGAMGLPGVRWPSGIEMTPQLDIRERLDLYCGLRPIYLFHSQDSPLRDRTDGGIVFIAQEHARHGCRPN